MQLNLNEPSSITAPREVPLIHISAVLVILAVIWALAFLLFLLKDITCRHTNAVENAAGSNDLWGKQRSDLQGSQEDGAPARLQDAKGALCNAPRSCMIPVVPCFNLACKYSINLHV